jgi:hypothetical protein
MNTLRAHRASGNGIDDGGASMLDLQDWRARSHAFADMGAVARRRTPAWRFAWRADRPRR